MVVVFVMKGNAEQMSYGSEVAMVGEPFDILTSEYKTWALWSSLRRESIVL
jgi:hypothetical protein